MQEMQFQTLGWKDPLEEENGIRLQYSCLENSMDKRSLAGYSLWGQKESDTGEQLNTQHSVRQLMQINFPIWYLRL